MTSILRAAALATLFFAGGAHAGNHDVPGFVTLEKEGRLWVFKKDSKELAEFQKGTEPEKHFTDIGNGPNGKTVKAADQATLDGYLAAIKSKK